MDPRKIFAEITDQVQVSILILQLDFFLKPENSPFAGHWEEYKLKAFNISLTFQTGKLLPSFIYNLLV